MKWHDDYLKRVKQAIAEAKKELDLATYLSEGGKNAGLRSIYSKRSMWLHDLLHAANEEVKQQEFVGNFIPCIKGSDVWYFCSCCGYVVANARYDADYEDIGIKPYDLNVDMEMEFCPHCGQRQVKYFDKKEEAVLREKWENGDI